MHWVRRRAFMLRYFWVAVLGLGPLGSTALLLLVSGGAWGWRIGLAAVMIVGAALLGTRAR